MIVAQPVEMNFYSLLEAVKIRVYLFPQYHLDSPDSTASSRTLPRPHSGPFLPLCSWCFYKPSLTMLYKYSVIFLPLTRHRSLVLFDCDCRNSHNKH